MSNAHPPALEDDRSSPFVTGFWGRLVTGLAIVASMAAILFLMGRHIVCPCGTVRLWQVGLSSQENSQQFADWYSALHVIFGMGLFVFVSVMRPHWSLGASMLAVLVGHTIWELAENTPLVIGLFSGAQNAADYSGDSILNSLGDTLFAMLGAIAMSRLSWTAAIVLALALELAVSLAIDDGFVIGTLRLVGFDI